MAGESFISNLVLEQFPSLLRFQEPHFEYPLSSHVATYVQRSSSKNKFGTNFLTWFWYPKFVQIHLLP
ncbi:hypothetical protein F383_21257 [Gossypium arboreum]|uniref:Uncharacterized protein n=1 Tax=Gossypium arboreum TaxID=29729 RepID=A0A0B0NLY2_GOSAR|nr:hypothetical protein F383_21257 [Gossypium arboreum]